MNEEINDLFNVDLCNLNGGGLSMGLLDINFFFLLLYCEVVEGCCWLLEDILVRLGGNWIVYDIVVLMKVVIWFFCIWNLVVSLEGFMFIKLISFIFEVFNFLVYFINEWLWRYICNLRVFCIMSIEESY